MKAVLPALTGKGYADMEIGEGGKAAREYLRVTYGDVDGQERARVRKLLEEYCCQDTEGMADIMAKLYAGL